MCILQIDFKKHPPEEMELIANQIRAAIPDEQVLVIPTDVNFIQNLTDEQVEHLKYLFEKELEERHKNDL